MSKPRTLRWCRSCKAMVGWDSVTMVTLGKIKACEVCGARTYPKQPSRRPIRLKATRKAKVATPVRRKRSKGKRGPSKAKIHKRLAKQANDLWAAYIKRNGVCYLAGRTVEFGGDEPWTPVVHQCSGTLQAAHGFGKKAHPSVRYEKWNGFPLCGKAHSFYSWQVHRWENFLRHEWGNVAYEERFYQACQTAKHDLQAVVDGLDSGFIFLTLK